MKNIRLPEPHLDAEIGEVLYKRRSVRRFSKKPLSVEEVSDILGSNGKIAVQKNISFCRG